jgi:Ca2+/Na+ antiporter
MQILLFLIFVLLILIAVVSKKNSFSRNQKIIVTVVATIFVVAVYFYESSSDADAQKNRDMVNAFRQGQTLVCKGYEVDNTRFIYVSGTQTFIPKKSEDELKGVILEVSTCRVD